MHEAPAALQKTAAPGLPNTVRAIAETFERNGFEAWLVGESLFALCNGMRPEAFELSTSATLEQTLALFASAVPTHAAAGIATIPAPGTSVDVVPFQRGSRVEDDLACRDFTILSMAWAPASEQFLDPHGGHGDSRRGLLRCPSPAAACLGNDPVRALRAARLLATYELEIDEELEAALTEIGPRVKDEAFGRVRSELIRLLLAEKPSRGLDLLRRTGLERRFFKPVRADAAALVDEMPAILHLRMAAWLRGTKTSRTFRSLRFGVARSRRVERMVSHHPLDRKIVPTHDRSVARMLRVVPADDIEALFRMRIWELGRKQEHMPDADVAAAHKQLDAVRRGIDRIIANRERSSQRQELAIDGTEVMKLLACPPGPRVGAAMRFLGEYIREDPARNEPSVLREALAVWARESDEGSGR